MKHRNAGLAWEERRRDVEDGFNGSFGHLQMHTSIKRMPFLLSFHPETPSPLEGVKNLE